MVKSKSKIPISTLKQSQNMTVPKPSALPGPDGIKNRERRCPTRGGWESHEQGAHGDPGRVSMVTLIDRSDFWDRSLKRPVKTG